MKLLRRQFLHVAASVVALPATSAIARADVAPAKPLADRSTAPLADRLAAYADRLRYDDLDAATVERVKSHVIDTLGCGIAAFDEAPVRICRDVALAPADGVSTVIGTNRRSTPELASFANGAAFRYYDLNDAYASMTFGAAHPSDHIAACLAIAESEHASAAERFGPIADIA